MLFLVIRSWYLLIKVKCVLHVVCANCHNCLNMACDHCVMMMSIGATQKFSIINDWILYYDDVCHLDFPLLFLLEYGYTVEPPIENTPNKGHNRNNLQTMDKFQMYQMETFL